MDRGYGLNSVIIIYLHLFISSEEKPALILITYEIVRRLIRDRFIEATEIQGKYKITQNYYDYL